MLPYARPSITEAELAEVEACLESGWLSTGPRTERFEQALAAYTGAGFALGTNTGTAALHLALLAVGVGPGDEVVTTPMTWVSTANVILHAGATPVFADVDEGTLNLDPACVEEALSEKTRTILPVHYAGLPCDMDAIVELARARGASVVEDGAHALGARYKGRPIGSIGDATMFSFHPAKNMTTGEGGALVTSRDDVAVHARRLRFHGIDQSPQNRFGGRGPASYDVVEAGFKYNISDLQSAIGLHQLAALDERNQRRRSLAGLYRRELAHLEGVRALGDAAYDYDHAWHMMVVRVDTARLDVDRDGVVEAMRERGIGAGVHFVPLHLQTLYARHASRANLPNATRAHAEIVTLPLFPDMSDEDVARVIGVLEDVLTAHAGVPAGKAIGR